MTPRNLLAGLTVLAVAMTAAASLNVSSSGVIGGDDETEKGQGASLASSHGGVRADVDRPKPIFLLHERDKRIHGYKPFQELIDKAPTSLLPILMGRHKTVMDEIDFPYSPPQEREAAPEPKANKKLTRAR